MAKAPRPLGPRGRPGKGGARGVPRFTPKGYGKSGKAPTPARPAGTAKPPVAPRTRSTTPDHKKRRRTP